MMKNNNDFDILNLKTELSFRGYSEATKKIYVQTVTNFLNEVNKEAIDIKREDVVRYLDINLKTVSKNTRGVYLNALEFFFEEVLGLDITASIKNYKREFLPKIFISLNDFNILEASVAGKVRLMYLIIREAGLNLGQLANLKLDDIDFENNTLMEKKVSRELLREIQRHCDREAINERIFNVTIYTLINWNNEATEKYLGQRYKIEDIRHGIALEVFLKKGDEEGATKYLGVKKKTSIRQFYKRAGVDYRNK